MQVLFLPLHDEDVLVPREVYFYKRRAHWAALVPLMLEALAIITLSLVVIAGTVPASSTLLLAILILAGISVWRMIHDRDWSWIDYAGLAVGALLVVSAGVGIKSLAVLAILWTITRLSLDVVRWGCYEVRYITNRRIIEINGLLGRRISSMPLHQVTDITLRRGMGGEIFRYGELRIESAGQEQALGRIPYLVDDEKFHDVLVHLAANEAVNAP
ncbi:MAG: PH domain-containing protein [Acidimicrobiales bacterium]